MSGRAASARTPESGAYRRMEADGIAKFENMVNADPTNDMGSLWRRSQRPSGI